MVFVADALGAWLTGLVADAGSKKLTALVLGTDQERALRSAATAAVWSQAARSSPSPAELRVVDHAGSAQLIELAEVPAGDQRVETFHDSLVLFDAHGSSIGPAVPSDLL